MPTRSLRSRASAISRACAAFMASGFSQKTCLPACNAASVTSQCSASGVATVTASISGRATSSWQSVCTSGTSKRAASRSTRAWLRAQRATTSPFGWAWMPGIWHCSAKRPAPTTPTLTLLSLMVVSSVLERRRQHLRLAGLGGAVGRLDDLDDVAGVLRRDDTGLIVANPVHQLHHVFVDVLLLYVSVGANDVRQHPLAADPAHRGLFGEIPSGIVKWLAVELQSGDRPLGAEIAAGEAVVDAPVRRSVGQHKQALAEVEQHQRVVVGIDGYHLAAEFALLDAGAGHRRDPTGRTEDAGQAVQGVDGHVVERAARGFAPVPG